MAPELIVVNGPQAGTRFALDKDEFFIGRAPNSAIVLPEPEIAWRHCQVRLQAGRYLVSDLRTSSGTYVNGMRSAERWLEDRDQIGIGKDHPDVPLKRRHFRRTDAERNTGHETGAAGGLLAGFLVQGFGGKRRRSAKRASSESDS